MEQTRNGTVGTNIFATKLYVPVKSCMDPLVANEGRTGKEVEG